jgi:hypothetical protein
MRIRILGTAVTLALSAIVSTSANARTNQSVSLTYDSDGRVRANSGEGRALRPVKARRQHTAVHWYRRHAMGQKYGRRAVVHRYARRVAVQGYVRHARRGNSVSLVGVVSPLAAKASEIVSACGSVVVSARSSRGGRSNHPLGRAVDVQGNPRCIYAHLAGWPGGYSTDYGRAPGGSHVHISYNPGGQEWGLRFAHGVRYTRRQHHRFAHAG